MIVFQLRRKILEVIVANAFSTLKLLMMPRKKIRHELQLEDELCLLECSGVALVESNQVAIGLKSPVRLLV